MAKVREQRQEQEQVQVVPLTKEEAEVMSAAMLVKAWGSKSDAIRGLHALGFTAGDISRMLGIIYQHARNVILRPLKRKIKAEREQQKLVAAASEGTP